MLTKVSICLEFGYCHEFIIHILKKVLDDAETIVRKLTLTLSIKSLAAQGKEFVVKENASGTIALHRRISETPYHSDRDTMQQRGKVKH
ncbi:MAG: hypothetical protein ABI723_17680 [Bacteroidia bacterium]